MRGREGCDAYTSVRLLSVKGVLLVAGPTFAAMVFDLKIGPDFGPFLHAEHEVSMRNGMKSHALFETMS